MIRLRRTSLLITAAACAVVVSWTANGTLAPAVRAEAVGNTTVADGRVVPIGTAAMPTRTLVGGAGIRDGSDAVDVQRRLTPVAVRLGQDTERAPIVPVGVEDDGAMEVPADVSSVGWYEPVEGAGVVPGDPGTAVLAGHVASLTRGPGAFHGLGNLVPDDQVEIVLEDGSLQRWRVVEVQRHEKAQLPLGELFVWDGPSRLALITCGGPFDWIGGNFRDNIVVLAVPV